MYQDLQAIFMLTEENISNRMDEFRIENTGVLLTFTVAKVRLLEYDFVNLHKRFIWSDRLLHN
jgi:hypothetical protein